MSAVRFSWALIEQRKRNNPLCESGGSVAAFGLVLARCARCRVMLGAVQCCALCSAWRGGGGCSWRGRVVFHYSQSQSPLPSALRLAFCARGRAVAFRHNIMLPYSRVHQGATRIHQGATPRACECRELSVRCTHYSMKSLSRFCLL